MPCTCSLPKSLRRQVTQYYGCRRSNDPRMAKSAVEDPRYNLHSVDNQLLVCDMENRIWVRSEAHVYDLRLPSGHRNCKYAWRRSISLQIVSANCLKCLNITATAINSKIVEAALGRHIMDPSIKKPEDMLRYSFLLWITQNINMIGVAFLKWSICAWLLVLNFSKLYKGIIWLSIAMVTVLNFLVPTIMGLRCVPMEANWNFGYTGEKKCFSGPASLPLMHTQGISSVLTDVVYMAAPLIYLSRVQLTKRTQWGIRFVFLLSIPYVSAASSLIYTKPRSSDTLTTTARQYARYSRRLSLKLSKTPKIPPGMR